MKLSGSCVPLVLILSVVTLMGAGASPGLSQEVLYEQPPLPFGGSSSNGQTITVADDFRLNASASLEQVVWWGGYGNAHLPRPDGDSFTLRIFSDGGGMPGLVLATYTFGAETRRTQITPTDFEYAFTLPAPLALEGNRTYWLSLTNVPTSLDWSWLATSFEQETCTPSAPCSRRSFGSPISGPWEEYYNNSAFRLLGASTGCLDVAIELQIEPSVINLRGGGRWVTGFLEPPAPYAASQIDVATVHLSTGRGSIAPDPEGPVALGDNDHDGVADLALKFKRSDVIGILEGNPTTLVVTGEFLEPAEVCFHGSDEVRVVPVNAPGANQALAVGQSTEIEWEPATDLGPHTVDLLLSRDDGETWTLEAEGLADDGHHPWTAHGSDGNQIRMGVVMVRGAGGGDARVGVSERFSILVPTHVGDPQGAALGLHGTRPHPARAGAGLAVTFSLPDRAPARLELLDIAGRRMAVREVGGFGPGRRTTQLGTGRLAAGVYRVRLVRGGESRELRVVVVP